MLPPTKIKESAEYKIRCYKSDYIPHATSHHFSIADVFQDLVHRDQGDTSRFTLDDGTPAASWARQPQFTTIAAECVYVYLNQRVYFGSQAIEQSKKIGVGASMASGFTLKPREFALNCVVRPTTAGDPAINRAHGTLRWRAKSGHWETYKPLRPPHVTCLANRVQAPDTAIEAFTEDHFVACQQFKVKLAWRGVNAEQTQPAAFRVMWGGDQNLSIKFHADSCPTVEYWHGGKWNIWKTLEGITPPNFEPDTFTRLDVLSIGGRLVVGVDGHYFECLGSQRATGTGKGTSTGAVYALSDVEWPAGPLHVRTFGVDVVVEVAKYLHVDRTGSDPGGDDDLDAPASALPPGGGRRPPRPLPPRGYTARDGLIQRDVPRPGLKRRAVEADNKVMGYPGGWFNRGTRVEVEATLEPDMVRYDMRLVASPDGVSAPFVNKMTAKYVGLFTVDEAPFLDILKACSTGRESLATPPLSMGAEWSIDVDRTILDGLSPTWKEYVKQYNPIEIQVRWRYTDGTYSQWVGRLKGYISMISMSVNQANQWKMQLQAKDPIWRLQKPNAVIDHRYYPLDFLWAQMGGAPIYGWQCVKEILAIELGEEEANRLVKYFPPFHYALMSATTDNGGFIANTQPPTGNGFQFPAPFGSTPFEWIKSKFAPMDYAQFFYGFANGELMGTSQVTGANTQLAGTLAGDTVAWPRPIYGQYPLITAGRPTWVIPDANYQPGDLNLIQFMAEVSGLPEEAINRVLVWSNPPQGAGQELPFPAIRQAERQLPDDDPNSALFSWARTMVKQGPQFFYQGAADYHAEQVIKLYQYKKIRRYTFEIRGEERMQWGDFALPKMVNAGARGNFSDPHLDVHGERFRVWRLNNTHNFHQLGPRQFTTKGTCLPVSALGF